MNEIYKHFKYAEFDQKGLPGSGNAFMKASFLRMLDDARETAGVPFKIKSGYRSKSYNKKEGGIKNSSHIRGYAADIKVIGSKSRYAILKGLILTGFTRIGIAETYIHADNDPSKPGKVTWLY